MSVIRCDDVGICFTRGSRRQMIAGSLRRLFTRRAPGEAEGARGGTALWALRHVDLDLPEGACLGVCGANGSGKTTLMRLLAGSYAPDEGRVHVDGRRCALLSLNTGMALYLSGHDNVFVVGAAHGLSRREMAARYAEIRDFAELDEETMRTPVRFYSSGMRLRLGFAIAATTRPDILLLDEVLAVGDASFRKKSADKLSELMETARCIVIASHNHAFLRERCERVVWLDGGAVRAAGPAAEVVDAYLEGSGRA